MRRRAGLPAALVVCCCPVSVMRMGADSWKRFNRVVMSASVLKSCPQIEYDLGHPTGAEPGPLMPIGSLVQCFSRGPRCGALPGHRYGAILSVVGCCWTRGCPASSRGGLNSLCVGDDARLAGLIPRFRPTRSRGDGAPVPITPASLKAGFNVETANHQGIDVIQSTIINELLEAELVLADLTDHNPNVLFELGLRMAVDKPVALIKATGTSTWRQRGASLTARFSGRPSGSVGRQGAGWRQRTNKYGNTR